MYVGGLPSYLDEPRIGKVRTLIFNNPMLIYLEGTVIGVSPIAYNLKNQRLAEGVRRR